MPQRNSEPAGAKAGEWDIPAKSERSEYLAARLGIGEVLCRLLISRGFDSVSKVREFIDPHFDFADIFSTFGQLNDAVQTIENTLKENKKIAVLADADADGVSGLLILTDALGKASSIPMICTGPGHGISPEDVAAVISSGAGAVITVDVGITENPAVEEFKAAGLKVIITDHHAPQEPLPAADAVIDPRCSNIGDEIAGCTVALYLAAALKLSRIKGFEEEKIFCDTETTGYSPRFNEIIEIGAIKVSGFRVTDTFSSFLKPASRLSAEITKITGITDGDLEDAPDRKQVLSSFREWIGEKPLYFHNARFDVGFIDSEFRRYLGAGLDNDIFDTLSLARKALPSQSHKLSDLKDQFKIDSVSHRALADADTAFRVYCMLTYLKSSEFRNFTAENMPLAAIGTLSDSIPLKGGARYLVKNHLKEIFKIKRFAFRTLIKKLKIKGKNYTAEATKKLIPFLNTPKKMGEPDKILELFNAGSSGEAAEAADYIIELSRRRRVIFSRTSAAMEKNGDPRNSHSGIAVFKIPSEAALLRGSVASYFQRKLSKPVIVLSEENGVWTGSARARGLDMLSFLNSREEVHEYGGHPGACGLKIKNEKLSSFLDACFENFNKPGNTIAGTRYADLVWSPDMHGKLPDFCRILEPFGPGNPRLRILVKDARILRKGPGKVFFEKDGKKTEASANSEIREGEADILLEAGFLYSKPHFRIIQTFPRSGISCSQ